MRLEQWAAKRGVNLDVLRNPPDVAIPRDLSCVHRGEIIRVQGCDLCGLKGVETKVYTCGVHAECTDNKSIRKIRSCAACEDRQTVPDPQSEAPPVTPAIDWLPRHVTRWAVGVTTAPRLVPTLARCVASIQAAGWSDLRIFAEPGSDLKGLGAGAEVIQRTERLGAFRNFVASMRELLAEHSKAQAILLFQDDVILCREVRDFLERDLWPSPKTGVISIYTPNHKVYAPEDVKGCRWINSKWLIGACALAFPRHVAEAIVAHPLAKNWRGAAKGSQPVPHLKKAVDCYVGHAVAELNLRAYYYNPSMVQHIATTSAIGHGGANGKRRSGTFPGETHRAIELYKNHRPETRWNLPGKTRRHSEDDKPLPAITAAAVRRISIVPRADISVVIPACGSPDLTTRCLTHLASYGEVSMKITVVDNGSKLEELQAVELHAAGLGLDLVTIRNRENLGFTPAVNQGLELSAGRHVLLLNNDCFVGPGCLPAMLRHLESAPKIAATGPLTGDQGFLSLRRQDRKQEAGFCCGRPMPDLKDPVAAAAALTVRGSKPLFMLPFFCTLLHRDAVSDVGFLDNSPEYSAGLGADDDWCVRARRKGWKLLVCFDAYAAHLHKESFRRLGIDRRALQNVAMTKLKGAS